MSPFESYLRQQVRGPGSGRPVARQRAAWAAIIAGTVLLLVASAGQGATSTPVTPEPRCDRHSAPFEHIGPKPGTNNTTEFVGEVIAVGEGILVVMIGEAKQVFVVNEKTQVTINHRPARLQDVMPGHTATVFSEKQGDQLIAKAVDARASY